MLPIRKYFQLNHTQQEIVVSSTVLAAFVASIIGGTINTKYGRRYSIQLAASIFTFGSLLLFISWNYSSLLIGRIIVGFGIGIASLTTPIYIAEVATPALRGKLVTTNAFMVYVELLFNFFLSFLLILFFGSLLIAISTVYLPPSFYDQIFVTWFAFLEHLDNSLQVWSMVF
jgi:MFS family permease